MVEEQHAKICQAGQVPQVVVVNWRLFHLNLVGLLGSHSRHLGRERRLGLCWFAFANRSAAGEGKGDQKR